MSKWRYGCGTKYTIHVPRGYSYREVDVECGSTAVDGGVNQCDKCAKEIATPPVPEYGDDI